MPTATANARPIVTWGTLVIHAAAGARVLLDGAQVGVTPLAPLTVPAGKHSVMLRHATLGERTLLVDVKADETKSLSVELGGARSVEKPGF